MDNDRGHGRDERRSPQGLAELASQPNDHLRSTRRGAANRTVMFVVSTCVHERCRYTGASSRGACVGQIGNLRRARERRWGRRPHFLGFKDLVREIRNASNLAGVFTDDDLDVQPLDEILGKVNDDYKVDVHQRIYELVSRPGSRPSPLHKAVVNLASASTVRLVTTNYDHHLSTLLDGQEVHEYLAPAVPMGDDFTGVVYIHGRLDQERRRLIATDDDFGKAYLNDAWAARFLDRMFGEYPVLFVGYSHNDTIMKYLARGLGGRSEKRYVLTEDTDITFWRRLGITTVHCLRSDQPKVLNDWATRSSEGLLGSRSRVKDLVAGQDPSPVPEAASFLETILSDKDTVRFFCEYARGTAWLQWAEGRPEFATLFYPSPHVDAESHVSLPVGLPRTMSPMTSCRMRLLESL
jgi:hypothetical protein